MRTPVVAGNWKMNLDRARAVALVREVREARERKAGSRVEIGVAPSFPYLLPVAEALAGSEEAFAAMMTRKARALGMSQTVYKNASGLPNDQQVTTARDQSMLGRAIQEHQELLDEGIPVARLPVPPTGKLN